MSQVRFEKSDDSIVVSTDYWSVEHAARAGGCWSSIKFHRGTRKNVLRSPITSRLRFFQLLPTGPDDPASYLSFEERLEKEPRLEVGRTSSGAVEVVAEGTYRDSSGKPAPARFRHRYEYRDWGLVVSDLEIIPEGECKGVLEVCAAEMRLRPGMTHAYVRDHPIPSPSSDLCGGARWIELSAGARGYTQRYAPIHVVVFEKGVEGIEVFPSSDLAEWDTSLTPDVGMGLYQVRPEADGGTAVSLNPYCVAYRRLPITLSEPRRFRLYWGLPFVKDGSRVGSPHFHAALGSHWASDEDLERLAAAGVKLLRFHNDYREDGPFWHGGMYPPYDEHGMAELRRIISTAHGLGMKIVPYISLKEFHPESPGYAEHADEWGRVMAPTFRELHTWAGTGEFGRVMCMESGWLDFRKASVDTILSDLPWDGLYFDWTQPLPCRNTSHMRGEHHTDSDGYLDFLFFCRERVGPDGVLFLHLSGHPYIVAENLSDLVFIYEDIGGYYPEPGNFPPQCDFVPIAPRHLVGGAAPGTSESRKFLMASILQGHPPCTYAPPSRSGFAEEALAEMELFAGEDLSRCRFLRAGERPVETGRREVYGSLWSSPKKALVYLGNFSGRRVRGRFRLEPRKAGFKSGKVACRQLGGRKGSKAARMAVGRLRTSGVPYSLAPWNSALYRIER